VKSQKCSEGGTGYDDDVSFSRYPGYLGTFGSELRFVSHGHGGLIFILYFCSFKYT
jgi:hypothetical protein